MSDDSAQFWDYTLALYGAPGLSQAVIGLQDRRGADVNLLLYCCWCATSGRGALDERALANADSAVDHWRRTVTQPLRTVRDAIRNDPALSPIGAAADTRKKVLAAEIDSERVAQCLMQAQAPPADSGEEPLAAAARSLLGCCRRLGFVPAGEDMAALRTLLGAAFANAGEDAVRTALESARG